MPATEEKLPLAYQENDRMAQAGERVMVVARRDFDPQTFDPTVKLVDQVTDLTLLAMVGIVDPPRPEATGRYRQVPQRRHPGTDDYR